MDLKSLRKQQREQKRKTPCHSTYNGKQQMPKSSYIYSARLHSTKKRNKQHRNWRPNKNILLAVKRLNGKSFAFFTGVIIVSSYSAKAATYSMPRAARAQKKYL